MQESQLTVQTVPQFQLKGSLFTLTTLQLLGNNLQELETQLFSKIQQAPKFFANAPLILDVSKLQNTDETINYTDLKAIIKQHNLIPVGLKGCHSKHLQDAKAAGFAILQDNTAQELSKVDQVPMQAKTPNSKLITEPVRSGQQIYAPQGDLIVMASVSEGAELLAAGHIHVYGRLKGRALAGINGDNHAVIFCRSLEAELISIAGEYKLSEEIEKVLWKTAAAISLKNHALHIEAL